MGIYKAESSSKFLQSSSRGRAVLFCFSWLCLATYVQTRDNVHVPIGVILNHSAVTTHVAMGYEMSRISESRPDPVVLHAVGSRFVGTTDSLTMNNEFCRLLRENIFGVIGSPIPSDTISALQAHASAFEMPVISTGMAVNNSGQDQGYVLFMEPYYMQAVVDVIRHYDWTEVWYIFNSNDGLIRLNQLLHTVSKANFILKVNIFRVNDDASSDAFESVINRGNVDQTIILDLPVRQCEIILNQEKKHFLHSRPQYFVLGLELDDIDVSFFDHGGLHIVGFKMLDSQMSRKYIEQLQNVAGSDIPHGKLTIALAVDSVKVYQTALEHIKKVDPNIFSETSKNRTMSPNLDCEASRIEPWKLGSQILRIMKETSIQDGLSGHVSFDEFGLRRDYKLQLLETTAIRPLCEIGTWHDISGFRFREPRLVRNYNKYYKQSQIVSSVLTEPFLMLKEDHIKHQGNERFEGYCVDLVKMLSYRMDLDLEIRVVRDGKYGSMDSKGMWNGMIGELIRHEADLAVAPLTITSLRERYVDFSGPFMNSDFSVMIKKPTDDLPEEFLFCRPFTKSVWLVSFVACLGVSVVLYFVSSFSAEDWHVQGQNTSTVTVVNNFTLYNSLWYVLALFMHQQSDRQPSGLSVRVLVSFWWTFCLVFVTFYIAQETAFRMSEKKDGQISSVSDLAAQTKVKYGTVESGFIVEYFRTSTVPLMHSMWQFMNVFPEEAVKNNEEGIQKVRDSNGHYAFVLESHTNDYVNNRKPCDTTDIGTIGNPMSFGVATPKGSWIQYSVKLAILELEQSGALTDLRNEWWIHKGDCKANETLKNSRNWAMVPLQQSAGLFYVLIAGLCLGLIVCGLEIINNKYIHKCPANNVADQARPPGEVNMEKLTVHNTPEDEVQQNLLNVDIEEDRI